jgi:hypothetical protein
MLELSISAEPVEKTSYFIFRYSTLLISQDQIFLNLTFRQPRYCCGICGSPKWVDNIFISAKIGLKIGLPLLAHHTFSNWWKGVNSLRELGFFSYSPQDQICYNLGRLYTNPHKTSINGSMGLNGQS